MDWLLSLLPAPLYYAVILGLVLTSLLLFGPDVNWGLERLRQRCHELGIREAGKVSSAGQPVIKCFLAPLTNAIHIPTEPSLVSPSVPLQFDIGSESDDRSFAYLGKRGRWKPGWVEYEPRIRALVLRKLQPSGTSLKRNKLQRIITLESIQKITTESADNGADTPSAPIAISFHHSSGTDKWPLRLLSKSPETACNWLQRLQEHLLMNRPALAIARPPVTEQVLTDRLKLVCQAEAASFSVDLLALLLREFGVFAKRSDLKSHLQKTTNKQKVETYRETLDAAKEVLSLMDGSETFERYAAASPNNNLMTVPEFHRRFVTGSQGLKQSLPETLRQLRSIATVDNDLLDLMLITRRLFKAALASKLYTMPLRADQLELREPLSLPLTDYFISTSHNTYLMEDQLKGRSDCLAYEIALKKNCRCVELDIHNGPNNDPIITHGGTMTSRIRFEDVVKTIKRFAFVTSEYPLVLSFENHCGLEQQDKMAQILSTHLKEYLYVDENADQMERLPSPEELKRKIIIKNKKSQPEAATVTSDFGLRTAPGSATAVAAFSVAASAVSETAAEDDSDDESDVDLPQQQQQQQPVTSTNSSPHHGGRHSVTETTSLPPSVAAASLTPAGSEDDFYGISGSAESGDQASVSAPRRRFSSDKSASFGSPSLASAAASVGGAAGKKRKKLKVSHSLSDLVSICRPVKFKGQKYAREHYRPVEMSSLVEGKVEKKSWMKKDGEDANRMVLHTQYQLVRVYPSGLRTNSSNYNPINGWRLGCQLVALNYQTRCENMELNDGLFQLNGSCGYVPKPAILTDPATKFNPFSPPSNLARNLCLEIVSGINLRLSPAQQEQQQQQQQQQQCSNSSSPMERDRSIDSADEKTTTGAYVKATVYGVPGDEKKDKTRKADQGFNPRWQYRCFEDNRLVKVPDLAHLRLEAKDKNSGKTIGQFTAPLTAFNRGYLRINLKDAKDLPTASELWIKIKLKCLP